MVSKEVLEQEAEEMGGEVTYSPPNMFVDFRREDDAVDFEMKAVNAGLRVMKYPHGDFTTVRISLKGVREHT